VNRERHRYWSAYIADLQGRMLLADWEVHLEHEPCGPCAAASVRCVEGQKNAYIRLRDDFDDHARTEQRKTIVHELVHLHLVPMRHGLGEIVNEQGAVGSVIVIAHRSHEEYAVDDLARIISPTMPLPPKVAKP
jgi:hypothetical protein